MNQLKFLEDLKFIVKKAETGRTQIAAFSATYTPQTLTIMRSMLPDARFLLAQSNEETKTSIDETPHLENIKKFYIPLGAEKTFAYKVALLGGIL